MQNTAPETFFRHLETVEAISCREQPLAQYISERTGKTVPVVADPTLLLPRSALLRLEKAPRRCPRNYILVYQLAQNARMTAAAKRMAKQSGKRIVTLFGNLSFSDCTKRGLHSASIEEFLWLLHHADAVLTNSFHGVSLSIALQRDFLAFEGSAPNERVRNLLCRAGLENRLCRDNQIPSEPIDYRQAEDKLQPWLSQSKQFILQTLTGAEARHGH